MDDQIPLTGIPPRRDNHNSAYKPEYGPNASYSKVSQRPQTTEIPAKIKDSSSRDPHQWSTWRKGLVFLVVAWCTFLGDFGSRISASFKGSVANQFNVSQNAVGYGQDVSQLVTGIGGVIAVLLSVWWGRLPVLFWFTVVALCTAAGAASANSLAGFIISRILNGISASAAQGTGLLFISDMFDTKRTQARVINIWEFIAVLSPYLGPFFANVVAFPQWRSAFWMYTGVTTFVLVGVIFLGRETWYHPQLPPTRSKPLELLGIEQLQSKRLRPSLIQAVSRAFKTVTKPAVLLLDLYYLVIIAWVVPISTVLLQPLTYFQQGIEDGSKGSFEDMEQNFNDHFGAGSSGSSFYSFSSGQQLGAFFLAPAFALVLSFGVSHYLHRRIDREHSKAGREAPPETRLSVIWIGQPFVVLGLLLFGVFVQKNSHYILVALAWAMYVFGTLIITVGVATYQAEAFPRVAGEAGAWISFAREFGGYILTFVAANFAKGPGNDGNQGKGAAGSFGAAAGISVLVCPIISLLQFRGEDIRRKGWDLDLNG